jgi:hypothetical protein
VRVGDEDVAPGTTNFFTAPVGAVCAVLSLVGLAILYKR